MKEKVKAAPKELVRRGLDDGTERLRGQFRETAQGGQASDYGGDRIEDAAADGARRAERGVAALLKKKRSGKGQKPKEEPRTAVDPSPREFPAEPPFPESPAEPPSPHGPFPREQPRIRTRETVSAREGGAGAGPPESRRGAPSPSQRMTQARIKTREAAVHNPRPDVSPAPQAGLMQPQVRTRETAARDIPTDMGPAPQARYEPPEIKTRNAADGAHYGDSTALTPDHGPEPPDRLSIKTKDAYIQIQSASAPEQPPQASAQGKQDFVRERGRIAAIERAEAQRVADGAGHPIRNGGDAAPTAPARRGYAGGQSKHAPAQAVRRPVRPGKPDARPAREGGQTVIKTARSGRKTADSAARQTIKTAERSSHKAIKTTQGTVKTTEQTFKTAQATGKAAQRAVQAARATAKTAAPPRRRRKPPRRQSKRPLRPPRS